MVKAQVGIGLRRRTHFEDDITAIFKLDSMCASDARAIEERAANCTVKLGSAKLIRHASDALGIARAKAI